MKSPLRWSGAALIVVASLGVSHAGAGRAGRRRRSASRCAAPWAGLRHANRRDTFAFREWLAADADARSPKERRWRGNHAATKSAASARLADGRSSPFASRSLRGGLPARGAGRDQRPEAPPACAATAVDRRCGCAPARWRSRGPQGRGRRCSPGPRATTGRGRGPRRRGGGAYASRAGATHARDAARSRTPRSPRQERSWIANDMTETQYFRNSPTSLPWMRTRLGGRMRTS